MKTALHVKSVQTDKRVLVSTDWELDVAPEDGGKQTG